MYITLRVENILSGLSEQSKILFSSPSFLILPDMKWDLTTLSSLYLVAIVRDHTIRSLRDLRRGKGHVELLREIRREAEMVVREKWGVQRGCVRMWVHYQPSYCESRYDTYLGATNKARREDHFHVHIVNVNQGGVMGMTVGQAHLLDDVISLVSNVCQNGR